MPERGMRVLIVDDEPDICWLFERALRPLGCAVTTTTSGAEALRWVASGDYALAFVDSMLPDVRGMDLAAQMRQRCPTLAVVLISGYFYREDAPVAAGLQSHLLAGFLAKPFNLSEMRALTIQTAHHRRHHATYSRC